MSFYEDMLQAFKEIAEMQGRDDVVAMAEEALAKARRERQTQGTTNGEPAAESAKDGTAADDFDARWDRKFSKYAAGGKLSAQEFDKMMQEMIDFEEPKS